ncbi:four-carbon acid sugar kinase family protein [Orrella sp. JC864]|uniref:four-carbon acid sugar kinase family protein n=1 Tax=Orrella sp. JC864 TaxID=3120298 RepID=UPI00300840A2
MNAARPPDGVHGQARQGAGGPARAARPPEGVLLAFYGDDFTGSTDAMEVLAGNGLDTLLFLDLPDAGRLRAACRRHHAIGIAGTSRAKDVAWMDRELPAVYERLGQAGAAICHYKVCSTFDSSPAVGNIGRAIEIGRRCLGAQLPVPMVVGAPAMRRYTVFGQLYAGVGEAIYRIDRHPTMSVHPVTPMHEADLRLHLASQAPLSIGLMDVLALGSPDAQARMQTQLRDKDVLMLDVLDDATQARAGELVWSLAAQARPLFCVGSSGLQYALVRHWSRLWPETVKPTPHRADAVDRIVVVSGSCSPVTGGQIRHALAHGFADLRADAVALASDTGHQQEADRLLALATRALADGLSPLIYTATGPDDPAVARLNAHIRQHGWDERAALARMAARKGALLARLLRQAPVARVVVCGGDTSGEVVQALGLSALRMKARLAPGAPLCEAYTDTEAPPALQIALKGGQIGDEDYLSVARAGGR